MSYQYREVFYKDYYSSQEGRQAHVERLSLLKISAEKLKHEVLPLLPKDKSARILDIGCGFGPFIYLLKQQGYHQITGIDVSEQQVAIAHELGLKEVIRYDLIDYLNQNINAFDVITGIDIIEHFSKDELVDVLRLVKNSLKANGIAIFRTPNMDSPFASIFSNGDFTHENYLNSSSAAQVMTNIGFTDIQVLPSMMKSQNALKEVIRKICWSIIKACMKLVIFSTGRTNKGILFTPNMLIRVRKF